MQADPSFVSGALENGLDGGGLTTHRTARGVPRVCFNGRGMTAAQGGW